MVHNSSHLPIKVSIIGLGKIGSQYDFNKEDYFYYKVNFDYNNYEYSVYRGLSNVRVGVGQNPDESIIWYEYVNP